MRDFKHRSTPVRVANDGTIVVPLIGRVAVAGYEMEQAEQILAGESIARGVFRNPNITVTMKQTRTNKITVVGAVNRPGTVELPRGSSSLLSAIVAVDGLSKEAGAEVEIRRTDVRNMPRGARPSGVMPASYSQTAQAASAEPHGPKNRSYRSLQAGGQSEVPICATATSFTCRRGY